MERGCCGVRYRPITDINIAVMVGLARHAMDPDGSLAKEALRRHSWREYEKGVSWMT
jgi:hypothetical protein